MEQTKIVEQTAHRDFRNLVEPPVSNALPMADGRHNGPTIGWGLQNKKILLTGASGGLGQAFAMYLANAGATVVMAARNMDPLQRLSEKIAITGGITIPVCMDVSDVGSMKEAVANAEEQAGPIDVLVNNAGIALFEYAIEQDVERWDLIQATNLRGPWFLSTEIARRMRTSNRKGVILNIASIGAFSRAIFMAGYCASKAALVQLTSCLALEFGTHGIRVNAIAPGIIHAGLAEKFPGTPAGKQALKRIPLRRFGTPEDLKVPLLWLCSDHSSFVTGSCVVVDGGMVDTAL